MVGMMTRVMTPDISLTSTDNPMWVRACVGAGLPANTVYQAQMFCLTHRFRGQARSHIWISISFEVVHHLNAP